MATTGNHTPTETQPQGELFLSDEMTDLTPDLQPLLALWAARHDASGFPARSSLTPRDLKAWLPGIHVYDVVENGRFTARLLGTAIVNAIGADQTGRTFGEHDKDLLASRAFRVMSLVVAEGKPYRTKAPRIAAVKQSWHAAESLWLPLGTDGKVQQVLAATVLTSLG